MGSSRGSLKESSKFLPPPEFTHNLHNCNFYVNQGPFPGVSWRIPSSNFNSLIWFQDPSFFRGRPKNRKVCRPVLRIWTRGFFGKGFLAAVCPFSSPRPVWARPLSGCKPPVNCKRKSVGLFGSPIRRPFFLRPCGRKDWICNFSTSPALPSKVAISSFCCAKLWSRRFSL